MPTYTITDPQTGQKVKLTGASPPSEAELTEIFRTLHPAPAPPREKGLATIGEMVGDVGIGAVKGVGTSAFGLGKAFRDYTPVGRISDAILPGAFDERPPEIVATNLAQKIGHGAEQIGEFFIPSTAIAKLGKVGAVARSAAQTFVQSGSPVDAGASGALTAALPYAGAAVNRLSGAVRESAEKSIAQALGATKEWAKSDARKLAPDILARGVKGSRSAMFEQAKTEAAQAGQALDAAYAAATQAGSTVPGAAIRASLTQTAQSLQVPNAAGTLTAIPGTERVLRRLAKLDEFVTTLGPDIPMDRAVHVKRTWDHIVSKAGLFGPKATASATDSADAWALREASNGFRAILNSDPSIAALNAEAAFWTGLKKVLRETEKRTQAQSSSGLVAAGTGGAGVIAGALSGDTMTDRAEKAILGGVAARQFVKVVQSPAFRTAVSGPLKNALADALATGSTGQTLSVLSRITAALPAQLRPVSAH